MQRRTLPIQQPVPRSGCNASLTPFGGLSRRHNVLAYLSPEDGSTGPANFATGVKSQGEGGTTCRFPAHSTHAQKMAQCREMNFSFPLGYPTPEQFGTTEEKVQSFRHWRIARWVVIPFFSVHGTSLFLGPGGLESNLVTVVVIVALLLMGCYLLDNLTSPKEVNYLDARKAWEARVDRKESGPQQNESTGPDAWGDPGDSGGE